VSSLDETVARRQGRRRRGVRRLLRLLVILVGIA
jgi:hypothetical protein